MVAPLSEMRDKSRGETGDSDHTSIDGNIDIFSHMDSTGRGGRGSGGT
jgi:hypothetical protein